MTTGINAVQRVFTYAGIALPDPDASLTPEQVKEYYTAIYPELLNAAVEGGDFDGTSLSYSFRRGTGTKG